MPNNLVMSWAGQALCMDEVVFQPICSNIIFLIGGWNENQHNAVSIKKSNELTLSEVRLNYIKLFI